MRNPGKLETALLSAATALWMKNAAAEEPSVTAQAAQMGEQARTVAFPLELGLGGGVDTLDSGTAQIRDRSAAFANLHLDVGVQPLVFPVLQTIYVGGEAEARFGAGAGLSVLEGEVGFRSPRFALDLGMGKAWNPLDGNAFSNSDGVPHVSVDAALRPWVTQENFLQNLSVGCSVGTILPQGAYLHPAYMDMSCGVAGNLTSKTPELPQREKKSSAAISTGQPHPQSEVLEVAQLVNLEQANSVLEKKISDMIHDFFVSAPGVKEENVSYFTGLPKLMIESSVVNVHNYYRREVGQDEKPHLVSVLEKDYQRMSEEDRKQLYVLGLGVDYSYRTQDHIEDSVLVIESINLTPDDLLKEIETTLQEAKTKGIELSPLLFTQHLLLSRLAQELPVELKRQNALNQRRYESYLVGKEEQAQRAALNALAAEDREACKKDPACIAQAELTRLSGDLKNRVSSGSNPKSGFPVYMAMKKEAENGALLSVDDYQNGYTACLAVGRVDLAIEATESILRVRYSREAVDQLASLRRDYGRIELNGVDPTLISPSFVPSAEDMVRYANNQLENFGRYEGYLPVGAYTVGPLSFEVKAGEKNKPVR